MATGTGKTLTSLNVVLEEYRINNIYNIIILVPTSILVNQWISECEKFNFNNIFSNYTNNWSNKIKNVLLEKRLGLNPNFIFISTYATFNGVKFQDIFRNLKSDDIILIADEVHNLGTKRSINNYLSGVTKRIGLSATPNRKFDELGTSNIEQYFNSYAPNHTYNYSMLKAIKDGFLTPYYYYPKFIKLTDNEMEQYAEYSERLLKFYDFEKGVYKEEATILLIQRKRIIHQASNKSEKLIEILSEINSEDLKHTIVYVPEGFEPDYSERDNYQVADDDIRIINEYTKSISKLNIKVHQIVGGTKGREDILKQFENGFIQVLTAMKTLDEGVYNAITIIMKGDDLTQKHLKTYLERYSSGVSFNTVRRHLNVLINEAVQQGMEENLLTTIKSRKTNAKLHKPYQNIAKILQEIKGYNPNLYLCCLMTYGCLLRPHREIRELTWGDFSEDLNYINLSGHRNKSGRNRIVPVPSYIRDILVKGNPNSNIFSGKPQPLNQDYFKTLWSRFKRQSNLLEQGQTLYSFRHSGAIDIFKRTGSLTKLQKAMGHSSINVSLTYLRGLEVAELKEEDMLMV